MKRLLALVGTGLLLAACGPSEEAMKGYRQCMSDKRKYFAELKSASLEACLKEGSSLYVCQTLAPSFYEKDEVIACKREYSIK